MSGLSIKDVLINSLLITLSIGVLPNNIHVSDVLSNNLKITKNIQINYFIPPPPVQPPPVPIEPIASIMLEPISNMNVLDVIEDSLRKTSSIGYLANRIHVSDVLAASMAITTKIKYEAFKEPQINQLIETAIDTSSQLEERKGLYIQVELDRTLKIIDDFTKNNLVGYVDISNKFGAGMIPKTYIASTEADFVNSLKSKLNELDEWKHENKWIVEIIPPDNLDTIDGHVLHKIWIFDESNPEAYKIESVFQFEFLNPNVGVEENKKLYKKLAPKYHPNAMSPCPNEQKGTGDLTKEECNEKFQQLNNEMEQIRNMHA